jgi:hypothetical protein
MELLSKFAFNFNLRRNSKCPVPAISFLSGYGANYYCSLGGAVQVDSIKTRFESAPGFSA